MTYYEMLIEIGYTPYDLEGMSDEQLEQLYHNETEIGMFLR
jgi:hypothetical protein